MGYAQAVHKPSQWPRHRECRAHQHRNAPGFPLILAHCGPQFPQLQGANGLHLLRDSKGKGVKTFILPIVSLLTSRRRSEKDPEFGTHGSLSRLCTQWVQNEASRGTLLNWTLPAHPLCPSLGAPLQEQCQPTTVAPPRAHWDTGSQGQWESRPELKADSRENGLHEALDERLDKANSMYRVTRGATQTMPVMPQAAGRRESPGSLAGA